MENDFSAEFSEKFHVLVNRNIAIYGTGDNASVILKNVHDFNFKCVISTDKIGQKFCGLPICSLQEAFLKVDVILIAAGAPSTTVVYNRIKDKIPDHIVVYDIRGHELTADITIKDISVSIVENASDYAYMDFLKKSGIRMKGNKIQIDNYKSIALLVAPITVGFIKFIIEHACDYRYILFASRDGFLLYQLYQQYTKCMPGKWAEGVYFYTSREAINKALVSKERGKYVDYVNSLCLNGKIAVVDVVTQGTIVAGLRKLTNIRTDLIAIGTTAVPNKNIRSSKRVHSMLGNVNEKSGNIYYSFSDFSELHLFLEMLYASTEGQFIEIDENGKKLFAKNEYSKTLLINVQNELKSIVIEMINKEDVCFSNKFATGLLRFLYRKFADYNEEIKSEFTFDDPFDKSLKDCNLIDKLGW